MTTTTSPRNVEELRKSKRLNWSAAADRIELFLDLLSNYYVGKTVKVDYRAAGKAVEYCRQRAAGKKYTELEIAEREAEMLGFLIAHNQSLDWVLSGDPTIMMAQLAEGTCSRKPPQLHVV